MSRIIRASVALLLLSIVMPAVLAGAQETDMEAQVAVELVVEGLDQPVFLTHAGDDRLFVLEKAGAIRIVENGDVLPDPFLDITDLVHSTGYEQGMLGLVFHPDYADNGIFYVSYSPRPNGRAFILARYQRSPDDPNRADPQSAEILLDVYHEDINHYGGMLAFGPDGYLYVSTGDGGGAYDPLGNAQDLSTLLGAILRLDVDGGDPYAIPPDNPFVGVEDTADEIWAYGLRNPWRFSFDHVTGDLFIADVGQEQWEEINIQPASSTGGENYGWPVTEGNECALNYPDCNPNEFTLPVTAYPHNADEPPTGCSVTGGHVYRGNPESPLYGTYFYGDFCTGYVMGLVGEGTDRQSIIAADTTINISSFGEDVHGELYLTDLYTGRIYHLTTSNVNPQPIVTAVHPATIPAGSAPCVVTVSGFNLRPDSTVYWNGEPRPTTRSGSTSLSFPVDTGHIANAGQAQITVVTPDPGGGESLPIELEIAAGQINGQAIANTWARTDFPVREGAVNRTWIWGPQGMFCATAEEYADAPDGQRTVQYFDKARMEVNNPDGDPTTTWYVTTGLLVRELITGELQVGDVAFEQREPADLNVAGDLDDTTGPTYATFGSLLERDPLPLGSTITQTVNRAGEVGQDDALSAHGVQAVELAEITDHVVAGPFWEFMNSEALVWQDDALQQAPLFEDPYYVTGLPISEAYWTKVRVAGTEQDVLVQAFERRVLTYTPANPPGWQVELGNVGLHYYFWRYSEYPYSEPYVP